MGSINQAMLETLRGMNTRSSGTGYDPNMPIPRPGQPTNYQMTPMLGNMGPYVNQDVNAFNAQQTIPGTWNGRPIPSSPTSTTVNIPGYGPAPVTYGLGMGDAAFNGTQPPSTSGWQPHTNSLIGGLLSQYMNENMSSADWRGLVPQRQGQISPQQASFGAPGNYGRQAMAMAGLLSPNNPPGDTYPNGLMGGKRPFTPGGK